LRRDRAPFRLRFFVRLEELLFFGKLTEMVFRNGDTSERVNTKPPSL
jgi:hypothetical protein